MVKLFHFVSKCFNKYPDKVNEIWYILPGVKLVNVRSSDSAYDSTPFSSRHVRRNLNEAFCANMFGLIIRAGFRLFFPSTIPSGSVLVAPSAYKSKYASSDSESIEHVKVPFHLTSHQKPIV